MLGETLRAALNALSHAAPEWLVEQIPSEWFDQYGRRIEEYRLPIKDSEGQEWAIEVEVAGFSLLQAFNQNEDLEWLRELSVIERLRQMWVQHFWLEDGQLGLRETASMPLSGQRLHTPYDPQAR